MLVYAASVAVTSVILIRVPWHPLALWLAIGSLITARDVLLPVLEIQLASDAPAASIALLNLVTAMDLPAARHRHRPRARTVPGW